MATNKYVARVKGTIVGNRTSKAGRVYTHAIVVNGHDKTDEVVTWCGRLDLARREAPGERAPAGFKKLKSVLGFETVNVPA